MTAVRTPGMQDGGKLFPRGKMDDLTLASGNRTRGEFGMPSGQRSQRKYTNDMAGSLFFFFANLAFGGPQSMFWTFENAQGGTLYDTQVIIGWEAIHDQQHQRLGNRKRNRGTVEFSNQET
jgi:hypothetical protein